MSKYWAFISYSHKDEERGKWGSWLHKSLERYRVPRQLVGRDLVREHVPKRLYPIFRDEEELPGTPNLTQKITEALHQSRYLIVIFSPDAVVFVIEYDDRRGELWSGRDGAKVADLGLSVEGSMFDPEGSRAVLWHTNGWGYLLDVDWLSDMAGRAATPRRASSSTSSVKDRWPVDYLTWMR